MTLKEFAALLDGRAYGHEITKEEEALAKELGFVVVFGYSDDNAELRGAIDDEIGCFGGGAFVHEDLPAAIYADWCPEDIDCSWAYGTSIPHEKFYIYEDGDLYCVGIVCDINKPKQTKADRIRAMSDKELRHIVRAVIKSQDCPMGETECIDCVFHDLCLCGEYYYNNEEEWLKQPAEVDNA